MKKKSLIIFLSMIVSLQMMAQSVSKKEVAAILDEGIKIYKLENACTFSQQVLAQKSKMNEVSGYLSYFEGKKLKCIFWKDNGTSQDIIYTVQYGDSVNLNQATFSEANRVPTPTEMSLIAIKNKVNYQLMRDTMFHGYKNIDFSIDLVEDGNNVKAFVLSTTTLEGRIAFGNDYLVNFDKNGNLLNEQRIHRILTPVSEADQTTSDGRVTLFMNGMYDLPPYITSTFIAQLLINNAGMYWQDFIYNTKEYVSVFNLEKNLLKIQAK